MTTKKIKYFLVILIGFGIIYSIYGEGSLPGQPDSIPSIRVSVSGVSSGGIMAQTLAATHPGIFDGVGLFSSGILHQTMGVNPLPWVPVSPLLSGACAAILSMKFGANRAAVLSALRRTLAQTSEGLALFSRTKFFVVAGGADQVLHHSLHPDLLHLLKELEVPNSNISSQVVPSMGHGMPILAGDRSLPQTALQEKDFLHRGPLDGVGAMFTFFFDNPSPRVTNPQSLVIPEGELSTLNLNQFTPPNAPANSISMAPESYIYVPKACRDGKTKLCQKIHVALHGCEQTIAKIGLRFMTATGYLQWAEEFNVIVIFPQVISTKQNPMGCWDWWGYTGQGFATKNAPQIQAIMEMVLYVQQMILENKTLSP